MVNIITLLTFQWRQFMTTSSTDMTARVVAYTIIRPTRDVLRSVTYTFITCTVTTHKDETITTASRSPPHMFLLPMPCLALAQLGSFLTPRLARSLLFFVVDSVCLYVGLVTLIQIDSSFLFLNGIEPIFGRHLSMWHSTKRCSSIFDLGPLAPKIYSPKFGTKWPISRLVCMAHRPEMFGSTRGFRGSPIQWNHTECCGRPLLPWQRHLC